MTKERKERKETYFKKVFDFSKVKYSKELLFEYKSV